MNLCLISFAAHHGGELEESRVDEGGTRQHAANGDPLKRLLQQVDPGRKGELVSARGKCFEQPLSLGRICHPSM